MSESIHLNTIPPELQSLAQWLCWKWETRNGKPTKPPYDVHTGHYAKSNDPETWVAFEAAVNAFQAGSYAGIGFAFHAGDGLTGIDVDYAWDSAQACQIRERFVGTYCERSPSGKLRIFCYGTPSRCGKGTLDKHIEVYDHSSPRYLTVTGDWIDNSFQHITDQQDALNWLHETFFKQEVSTGNGEDRTTWAGPSLSLSDSELLERSFRFANGAKIRALWYGDISGYTSQSEADQALCNHLAFLTQGDTERIERLFGQSALAARCKWEKRPDYRRRTIAKAIAGLNGQGYTGRQRKNHLSVSTPITSQTFVAPIQVATNNPVPDYLLRPPGRLADIADWINSTSTRPQPIFAVQAALAIGSVLCGRRYKTDQNNFSSLYFLNVGPSTAGKEHAKTCIEAFLEKADLGHLIGPSGYMSAGAVFSHLMEKPTHITVIDELGALLEAAQTQNNSYRREAMTLMVETFGRLHGTLRPAGYSTMTLSDQQRKEVQKRLVRHPALTLLGMTTPGTLYKNLSIRQVESGFLGRLLVVETDTGRQPAQTATWMDPSDDLIAWARAVRYGDQLGNLAMVEIAADIYPDAIVVPFIDNAVRLLASFDAELIEHMNQLDTDGLSPLLGRTREIAMRLSLINAVANSEHAISEEIVTWCIDYTRYWALQTVRAFQERVAESEFQAHQNECYRAILIAGAQGITEYERNRHRAFSKLTPKERNDVMDTLQAAGRVQLQEISTRGRKRKAWVAVTMDDPDA